MAMNKAEKEQFEQLQTALALCWPPYPCPRPMTAEEIKASPTVDAGLSFGRIRQDVAGFFINSYNGEVSSGFSNGSTHARRGSDSTWSQGAGVMYRTEREALMALRHEKSRQFAAKLAEIDKRLAGVVTAMMGEN